METSTETHTPSGPLRCACGVTFVDGYAFAAHMRHTRPGLYSGRDSEVEYLVTRYPDGTIELATRPLGGPRWSPPVKLESAP